jgi:phage gp36-like protein
VRNALAPGASEDMDTAASFADAQIEDAIKEADGVVDTYIYALFGIPQDPNDATVAVYPVRAWSRDIAAYLATLTFRKSKDMEVDDPVRLRYNYVIALLEKIASGELRPNLPQPPALPDGYGSQGAFVYNLYPFKLFTPADVWGDPRWQYGGCGPGYRYGDLHWSAIMTGSGYNEVIVLFDGQPIPAGTPDDTLVVFIPEGS